MRFSPIDVTVMAFVGLVGGIVLATTQGWLGGEPEAEPIPTPVKLERRDPWKESRRSQELLMAQEGLPTREVWYAFCVDARADGVAPIHRGSAGYRPQLDPDHDGLACEPREGR